jgi:hypothetical protein
MSSIIKNGDTYHGISVFGRGVFTYTRGTTYAGQCRDGYACGLGETTYSGGAKEYAEHGPDGKCDGRRFDRYADGSLLPTGTYYRLYERCGKLKDSAHVSADGRCLYNWNACAPDDPRLLALIAQVARPRRGAPRSPSPPSATRPPTRPQAIVRWIGRLVLPPQALATAVATEVHPHSARRRWWLRDTTQRQPHKARPHSGACTGFFLRYWSHGRHPLVSAHALTNNRHLVHTKGPSRQLRFHAIVQHAAVPNAATRGRQYVCVHMPHAAIPPLPAALLAGLCSSTTRPVWQAEEAVANLPLRLAVRAHCGHHICA